MGPAILPPAILAHGGTAGAIAEGVAVVLAVAALSFFVWRSTKAKVDEYDPRREPPGE